MLKTLDKFLIKKYLHYFIIISFVFFSLVLILSFLEEVSYFKNMNNNIYYGLYASFLNFPSLMFEIFPFIFLITTQFFFLNFYNNNEIILFKFNGIKNIRTILVIAILSVFIGLFILLVWYNLSAIFKKKYLELRNINSQDNKYLAVINENGVWIKDEDLNNIYIIKSSKLKTNHLENVEIFEYTKDFNLNSYIKSELVNIEDFKWKIINARINKKNQIQNLFKKELYLITHFNYAKINELYSNLSSRNFLELSDLEKDYERVGYSTTQIKIYKQRLYSSPIYFTLIVMFISIIMYNIKFSKSYVVNIIFGILLSVIIYYLNFLSSAFGQNENIDPYLSIWLPLLIMLFLIFIGVVRINEK